VECYGVCLSWFVQCSVLVCVCGGLSWFVECVCYVCCVCCVCVVCVLCVCCVCVVYMCCVLWCVCLLCVKEKEIVKSESEKRQLRREKVKGVTAPCMICQSSALFTHPLHTRTDSEIEKSKWSEDMSEF